MSDYVKAYAKVTAILSGLTDEDRTKLVRSLASAFRGESGDARRERARERMRTVRARSREQDANSDANGVRTPSLSDSPSRDLSLSDSLIPKQIREESVTDGGALALPAPVTHAGYPQDIVALQWAYEETVRRVTHATFGLRITQLAELVEVVRAHALDAGGAPLPPQQRPAWVRHEVAQFAAFVQAQRGPEAKFWNMGPKCLMRWLNETPPDEAKSETRIAVSSLGALAAGIGKGGGA